MPFIVVEVVVVFFRCRLVTVECGIFAQFDPFPAVPCAKQSEKRERGNESFQSNHNWKKNNHSSSFVVVFHGFCLQALEQQSRQRGNESTPLSIPAHPSFPCQFQQSLPGWWPNDEIQYFFVWYLSVELLALRGLSLWLALFFPLSVSGIRNQREPYCSCRKRRVLCVCVCVQCLFETNDTVEWKCFILLLFHFKKRKEKGTMSHT